MDTIAVVGSGAAGLTAAYILQRAHRVTLFEKNDYPGGHTHTVTIPGGPDAGTPVDTGFIVMNHRNYPVLTRLFEQLGVALKDSDMSFSYWDRPSGLQYAGSDLNGLFAQRRNLLRPSFLRMVRDTLRFYRRSLEALETGALGDRTLGEYLQEGKYSDVFVRDHIIPMGAAIWSTPCDRMMSFPAASFLRFLKNHGLLSLNDRPQWRTVEGGSRTYVERILAPGRIELRLKTPVERIRRGADGVYVTPAGGAEERYDQAVIAAHADQALALLADPSDDEEHLLGAWRYQDNDTVLHTDDSVMPPLRRAWASWNFTREADAPADGPATLSYHMNRLQCLATERSYFVTLNRPEPLPAEAVIARMTYQHPTFSREALESQQTLPRLNGCRRTHFCGSYFGYGFHEDAVRSAVDACRGFGLEL